jgi:hypothetical protein
MATDGDGTGTPLGKIAAVATIIGVVLTVIALIVTLNPPNPANSSGQRPTQERPSTAQTDQPVPTTDPATAIAAPTFSGLRLEFAHDDVTSGTQVGPSLFQLEPYSDRKEVTVAFVWYGTMSDGTARTDDSCQILASISGPEPHPAVRSAACTYDSVNSFRSRTNLVSITTPGDYSVTVLDELTGVTATSSFTVVE